MSRGCPRCLCTRMKVNEFTIALSQTTRRCSRCARAYWFRDCSPIQSVASTENPSTVARMGRSGGHVAPCLPRPPAAAWRAGYRSGSRGWGFVRRRRAGRTASRPRCARQARQMSRSWARSASRQGRGAGRPVTRRGRPRRSATLGIGVPKPPGCGSARALPLGFLGAPAALACARPTVLSRRTADRSGSACRWARKRGQT